MIEHILKNNKRQMIYIEEWEFPNLYRKIKGMANTTKYNIKEKEEQ